MTELMSSMLVTNGNTTSLRNTINNMLSNFSINEGDDRDNDGTAPIMVEVSCCISITSSSSYHNHHNHHHHHHHHHESSS